MSKELEAALAGLVPAIEKAVEAIIATAYKQAIASFLTKEDDPRPAGKVAPAIQPREETMIKAPLPFDDVKTAIQGLLAKDPTTAPAAVKAACAKLGVTRAMDLDPMKYGEFIVALGTTTPTADAFDAPADDLGVEF